MEAPLLHAPSTTIPHAATMRPAATLGVSESVLVQNTTIFNNSKAKTKLQCDERKVRLVVASPEIGSSAVVIAFVLFCVKEKVERERHKDYERMDATVFCTASTEIVREITEKGLKK
ncbi:hypothetical protein D8674_010970 [Pyrus ussuriensis x Pyrus communis]|uniref:Uncharacterized protein n=1 Tax=Pyrus ussuriensis x Pyrus communis TaxID=2448454 RepID=A0A5N5G321_9ROSA|nr:hypothetical protein D8674_010970 [Pyrus ussuriensis x Pyrus communis]